MSNEAPSAGWYPNPDGTGGLRWWSGVGWTQYTRTAPANTVDPAGAQTQPGQGWNPSGVAEPAVAQPATPSAPPPDQGWTGPNGWQATQTPSEPLGGYTPYSPAPARPLTASGMRPVAMMFSDIARITRRAWWPILAISVIIWTVMTAVLAGAAVALVDIPALRRGLDALGVALDANPDGSFTQTQIDQLQADFSDAFGRIPVGAWVAVGVVLGVLTLLASTVQIGAVNRLAMDAATANTVSWSAAWKSGFTGGFRLFGYYVLLSVLAILAFVVTIIIVALAAQIAPAVAVALGILAFFGWIAAAIWLTGRLVPVIAQAVVGNRALRWSWRATKGKFWAVFGRYLLWSLAASLIVNVIVSVISVPVSLIVLGQSSTTSDSLSSMGLALILNLLLMPVSMALAAITFIGIVPIWRDLTDHPVYRSIDDNGVPIPAPEN
ncbi:MAG: DUF2510 domain-containing protein [Candidatus Nanopelagicales bacterium]